MVKEFCRRALLLSGSCFLALALAVSIPIALPGEGGEGARALAHDHRLNWQTSLAAGSDQARLEHKYVLADVFTVWCGWCKKLDKDVFTDSELVDYLQKDFICVKVNAEDPREGVPVAQVYKVHGFPCSLVFSPEGRLVGRVGGYMPAKSYLATLQRMTSQASPGPSQFGMQVPQGQTLQPVTQLLPDQPQQQVRQNQWGQNSELQPELQPELQKDQQLKQLEMMQQQWQQQNQQQRQPQQIQPQ